MVRSRGHFQLTVFKDISLASAVSPPLPPAVILVEAAAAAATSVGAAAATALNAISAVR